MLKHKCVLFTAVPSTVLSQCTDEFDKAGLFLAGEVEKGQGREKHRD